MDGTSGTSAPSESLLLRLRADGLREEFLRHKARKLAGPALEELAAYVGGEACTRDLEALAAGSFDLPLARQVRLRKSHSDRRRIIYIYPPRQNMLMKYLTWGMREYDGIFSDSLYSFRQGASVVHLFRKVVRQGYLRDLYAVKADVHDYGHSIRPELLVPMLRRIMGERDPQLLAFLEYLLGRNEFLRDGTAVRAGMGGLPGVPVGSFFNNVYLMGLDDVVDAQARLYARYADDICAFVDDAGSAADVLGQIRACTAQVGLALNEDKTQLIEPGDSIELLGIQIRDGNLDVADNTIAKARTKLTHHANGLVRRERRDRIAREEGARRLVSHINRYFYGNDEAEHQLSWRDFFFPVITRPDSLHEIDLVCQDLIRIVATGKRGDARYRFRYADMRALGYRPLVHEYYRHRGGRTGGTGETEPTEPTEPTEA